MEARILLLDLRLVKLVNFLELSWEIGQTLVRLLKSLNTEGQAVVVVLQRLDYELNRDFHKCVLDDVLIDDTTE